MNTIYGGSRLVKREGRFLACVIALAVVLLAGLVPTVRASAPYPGGTNFFSYTPLASFSFADTNVWTSDQGYAPIFATNLGFSILGNGSSLVIGATNPVCLNYYVYQPTNGATNLVVNGRGSLTFWFGPDWSSTNTGGNGPGDWSQLIDVGEWTTNAAYGYWGLSVDPAGENLWFVTQDALGDTYSLSAPISWTTNYFHFIALTYSSTNVSLYLDGVLATNDPGGLSIWPSSTAISNGFFIGSATNGSETANGLFDDIYTYNVPVDAGTIGTWFDEEYGWYILNPYNMRYMSNLHSAGSSPSYTSTYDVISGSGGLIPDGTITAISSSAVWLTNITATAGTGGTMNVTFAIQGGSDNVPYDVFANSVLGFGPAQPAWVWMGQGYHGKKYELTGLPNMACFLMLGTPYMSNSYDGLTDAYEWLVLQINPEGSQFDTNGVPYAWYAENGLIPLTGNLGSQDPDADGLLNYQEYFYGSRPLVNEGTNIWVGVQNGTSGIP